MPYRIVMEQNAFVLARTLEVGGRKQKAECRMQNAECRMQNAIWEIG
jgi:hypothetical protein